MKLPIEKSKIETDLSKYITFMYGREKIGKTSFAAQFPDALFLMCEPGGKSLEIFRIDINNWSEFLEAIALLRESNRFKTIIIDTVDLAFKYCSDYVCKKLCISHPSEEDWGKGWGMIRDEFAKRMSVLSKLNRGLILISHSEDREIKRVKGGLNQSHPTLSNQGRKVVEPMVDIWGYYTYENDKRYLQIQGNEEVSAGCRLTRNFCGIDRIDMGDTAEASYRNFIKAFNTIKEEKPSISKPKLKIRKYK